MIFPKITKVPDVEIPDVSKMSIVTAEATLKKEGFEVATEVEEEYSADIEEGMVIGTNPSVGRSVKKGTLITLIVSKGFGGIIVENYTGENIKSVQAKLEEAGIVVLIEYKEFKDTDDQKEDIILEQDMPEGTKMEKGDTITFQVSTLVTVYPNFVEEDWSYSGIEEFCAKNNITLIKQEKEDETVSEGTILAQSRAAGTKVVSGVTLRITVSKKPIPPELGTPDTEEEKKPDQDTSNPTDETDKGA